MIFLKISGGLGNQMFQYATALNLALLKKTNIGIDLSEINQKEGKENFTYRNFQLEKTFNISNFELVPAYTYSYIIGNTFIDKLKRKLISGSYFLEQSLEFDKNIFATNKNAYIEGYFQSEKYFTEHEKEIKSQFTFTSNLNSQSEVVNQKIINSNSIAIHIRRGDYVNNSVINSVHGACPLAYYIKALSEFNLDDHELFFFSDDISWVKDNFTFLNSDKTNFIDWNVGGDSWQDLALMSHCKNFIIANSSFSWWGAWLSDHTDKKVIAPKQWFNDNDKNKQTIDLLPTSWILV